MATSAPNNFTKVKEVNVILLGESGVGKSTFINSCYNYLIHESFSEVLTKGLEILIPARFDIQDINFDQKVVVLGTNKDNNECLEAGKAATQNVKTYVFPVENDGEQYLVRFFDTPGMGDQRGTHQDEINCELILSTLSQIKEIHGICLLLKPNNPRLDVFMNYCVTQILSRLESSAVHNVIFVFTNARGENYTPGKTLTPLRVLIESIKKNQGIHIPNSRINMFCFDNEAFRIISAISQNVEMEDFVLDSTKQSWEKSVSELWRMIKYAGSLKPHDLKKTITINEAKLMASQLTRPLTEIIQLIEDNLRLLNVNAEELKNAQLTNEELLKKMHIPQVTLEVIKLSKPQTVCCHGDCVSPYLINGVRKTHYGTICCKDCQSTWVPAEVVGSNRIYWWCSTFYWNGDCKNCSHSYSDHQHINYHSKVVKKDIDESIVPEVRSQEELVKAKEEHISQLKQLHKEYDVERQVILETCAIYDKYLKKNSIIPIGNPIEDYLQYQITREEAFCKQGSMENLNQLKNINNDYQRIKETLTQVGFGDRDITTDEIQERKRLLLYLKHFGPKIAELFNIQAANVSSDFRTKEVRLAPPKGNMFTRLFKKVKEVNLILVGESGVGKTFINSCYNYLNHESFSEVQTKRPEDLMPARFDIHDINCAQKVVELGTNQDNNECLEAGKAATQNVKTYVFHVENDGEQYLVRFFDTSGMGDQRGTHQEEINCELILSTLSQIKEIHGICLLLKPNNPRLDGLMNYCVTQILSRLESSAVYKVIFVFTNAQGENYTPGKTLTPLRELIESIKKNQGIHIPNSQSNMFCFDNEAFRIIGAISQGVKIEDIVFDSTKQTWETSVSELWRMIKYARSPKPHDLKKTITINEATLMASQFTRPLTEIIQLIEENLRSLDENAEQLKNAQLTNEELLKKMHVPQVTLEVTKLSKPQTVCCHGRCVSTYLINGVRKTHYGTICCKDCQSTWVPARLVRSKSIYWSCSTFYWNGDCKKCAHSYQHINYHSKVVKKNIDESIVPKVQSQEELVKAKEEHISHLKQLHEEYDVEKRVILETCVIYDKYLKKNSTGNPIEDNLQYQIIREKCSFPKQGSDEALIQLQKVINDYQRIKGTLTQADLRDRDITADEIQERKRLLLSLNHFGPKIAELFNIQAANVSSDFRKKEVKLAPPKGNMLTRFFNKGNF